MVSEKSLKGIWLYMVKGLNCCIMEFVFKLVCSSETGEVSKDECDIDPCFTDIILAGVCGSTQEMKKLKAGS